MSAPTSAARAVSSAGGQVLRAATRAIAARPAAKPLHPRGRVVGGTLHRFGADRRSGAQWLDDSGDDQVLVRQSRSVGLPAPAPDVHGLAVRVPTDDGRHGDLLFASTGLGRLSRFLVTPARSPRGRPLTTLLPYRTPTGPVVLSAVFQDDTTITLRGRSAPGSGETSPSCGWTRIPSARRTRRCPSIPSGTSCPAWRPTTGYAGCARPPT